MTVSTNPLYKKHRITLLTNATATGNWQPAAGGSYQLQIECATWNGAHATLQTKLPNGTAVAVGSAVTANGIVDSINVPPGSEWRILIDTAVPSVGVYAHLMRYRGPEDR